jgi:hypothetical protein
MFAIFFMIRKKELNGYYLLILFIGLIYIFSSWFIFSFGCGYGSRNFVEYTVVFALPLGYLYKQAARKAGNFRIVIVTFALLFILINLKLIAAYDKCFLEKDWDFKEYAYFLKRRDCTRRTFIFNKEVLTPSKEYSRSIRINMKRTTLANFRRARVVVNTRMYDPDSKAEVVIAIQSGDSTIYWNGYPLHKDYNFEKPGTKQRVVGDFWFPRYHTTDAVLSAYIWNSGQDSLEISKLKIQLK